MAMLDLGLPVCGMTSWHNTTSFLYRGQHVRQADPRLDTFGTSWIASFVRDSHHLKRFMNSSWGLSGSYKNIPRVMRTVISSVGRHCYSSVVQALIRARNCHSSVMQALDQGRHCHSSVMQTLIRVAIATVVLCKL